MKRIYQILFLVLFVYQVNGQEQLSLEDSRKLALEYNHKIKIANELIHENEANVKYAFTHFLPKFSIEGEYNFYHDISDLSLSEMYLPVASTKENAQNGNFTDQYAHFPGLNVELGDVDYFMGALNFEQPIYMGGKIRSSYQMAKFGKEISNHNYELQISDVLLETDQAYWQLVSVKEKVHMAAKYLEMLSALVRDLQNAYDLELTTRNELLKAKVQLNQAKLNLLRAKNAHVLSRMALCQVIGKDLQSDVIAVDTSILVEQRQIASDYLNKALLQRPELLIMNKQLDLSKENIKNTQADYLPQLGVGASYRQNSSVNDLIDANHMLVMQAKLSVPVFHWNERKHKLATAKSKSNQQELQLQRTKDLISLEVQQSYFSLQEAYEQIELAKISMKQANENVELTQNSFYEGIANTTELLDAQAFWQSAYSELIDAKINYKLQEVSFNKAIGELVK